jgi:hypothetical protein
MPAALIGQHNDAHNISPEVLQLILRRRRALCTAALATVFCADSLLHLERPIPIPRHTSVLTGQDWLDEIINGHPERCLDQLGMYPAAFLLLCWEFTTNGGLGDSRQITATEQTAIFVYWFVHASSQRDLMERFQRSNDTISRYTNLVLDIAVDHFYQKYVQNPADSIPPKIANSSASFPFFRYCRGAVDGTHIDAFALAADTVRYRDRHGVVSQNVLASCDFDLRFTYMMPGYEGTAADGRLFDTARRNGFALPEHRYYLGDAGFPNCDLILAPFIGTRYHLKEWDSSGQQPETPQELFNLRHSRLRNVIERIFGVLKRQFPILISRPECSYEVQAKIVAAAGALHNFLRIHDRLNSFAVEINDDEEYNPRRPPIPRRRSYTRSSGSCNNSSGVTEG